MRIIPLQQAVICVTCDSISDEKGLRCPACGSLGLMNLSRILGTMTGEHRTYTVPQLKKVS